MKHKVVKMIAGVLMLAFIGPVSGSTARCDAKTRKPWASGYKKIIKEYEAEFGGEELPLSYDLIYFNSDKIPELVVGQNGYWVAMYTYG